jgi:hypothetical protein
VTKFQCTIRAFARCNWREKLREDGRPRGLNLRSSECGTTLYHWATPVQ